MTSQEAPGFAIFFKPAIAAAMRRDAETDDGIEGLDGNDVPSFVRNDIGGQEINIGGGIASFYPAAGGSADAVGSAIDNRDRFHLHPKKAGASIHDEIVAGIVAEGPGDGEAESAGAPEKTHFSPLALTFSLCEVLHVWRATWRGVIPRLRSFGFAQDDFGSGLPLR